MGIKYAWLSLDRVAMALGGAPVYASTGNHDVLSRQSGARIDHDARNVLKGLVPEFPGPEIANAYWANDWALVRKDGLRLVILNSSVLHSLSKKAIEHGAVAQATLEALDRELRKDTGTINILLCHHHPLLHEELAEISDYDVMHNGESLLRLLESHGQWLVIHGHKHNPKIHYAQGGARAPIIFSAGSLCAELYGDIQTHAKNQFYLLNFSYSDISTFGLVGTFRAWFWRAKRGWVRAQSATGLPYKGGFGYRTNLIELAKQVATLTSGRSGRWIQISDRKPELRHIAPDDLDHLISLLKANHSVSIEKDEFGVPSEYWRP